MGKKVVTCPVCGYRAKFVKKNQCFDTRRGLKVVVGVPTIVCQNNDCGEESFDGRISEQMGAAMKGNPAYFCVVPIYKLPAKNR